MMSLFFALKLLLAHFLGDFALQPQKWVTHKKEYKAKSKYLYFHVGVHLLLLLLVLQLQQFWAVALLVVSHYLIDLGKLLLTNAKNERFLFVLDQLLHLLVIAIAAYIFEPFAIDLTTILTPKTLLFLCCIVFVTAVSGILMKLLLQPYITDLAESEKDKEEGASLKDAGRYIGMLERLFVFGFILASQWSAIGLLIAAKSVFRFGDLNKGNNRKLTEYVLIGTLLSFGLAILTGIAFKQAQALL